MNIFVGTANAIRQLVFDFSVLPFPNSRLLAEEMHERLSSHWVFKIPGVSKYNIAHDCLHVLFTHGIVNNAMGNALKHWCWKGPKGSRQTVKPDVRLAMILTRVQKLYREYDVSNTLSSLHLKDFIADLDKPHQCRPSLKVKGANCKALVPVFAQLSEELSDNSEVDLKLKEMFHHMHSFTQLLDTCAMFPTTGQTEQTKVSTSTFLSNAKRLNTRCAAESLQWSLQYKHHNAWNLAEGFQYMNPRFNWCFKGEDLVGIISKMCHSVVHGCKATNVNLKLFEKYRYQLCMKFTNLER